MKKKPEIVEPLSAKTPASVKTLNKVKKDTPPLGPDIYKIPDDHPLPQKVSLDEKQAQAFTDRNLAFSLAFFKRLSKSGKNNLIFSPIGLGKNMAMLHLGSAGETKKEIEKVMHFDASDEGAFYSYFGGREFYWTKKDSVLHSTVIFLPTNLQIKRRVPAIMSDFLRCFIDEVPFSDSEKARERINSRAGIGENEPVLPSGALPKNSRLVLSSSIHYRGRYTNYRGFAHDRGMIERSTPHMPYAKVDGVSAIELASDGKVLLILMPKDFKDFEENILNAAFIEKVKKRLKTKEVNLDMPSFKIHSQQDLLPLFESMGLKKASSDDADFSEFSYETLKLNALLHQSDYSFSADLRPEKFKKKFNLNIDKPFFFMLRDEDQGTLFFMGAIKDLAAVKVKIMKRP